jgi:hypothetical protein
MQQALDALKLVYEQADFSNGVTDPTGTMDEGKVVIGGIVSDAIAALEAELAKPEQESEAYRYAKRLAEFIWAKHYKEESPDWTPLPDVLGVLTQIDNMTCGLELAKTEQEPVRWFQQFGDAPPRQDERERIKQEYNPYEIGKRLQKEGYGISDIGIRVKCDADIEQALQGYCDQIKVQA